MLTSPNVVNTFLEEILKKSPVLRQGFDFIRDFI